MIELMGTKNYILSYERCSSVFDDLFEMATLLRTSKNCSVLLSFHLHMFKKPYEKERYYLVHYYFEM